MNRCRSILSVLIALWLPLQGYAAVAMPFCQHSLTAALENSEHADHSQHHHEGHPGPISQTDTPNDMTALSHASHASGNSLGSLGCDNCGSCHLACSPAVAAVAHVYLAAGISVLESGPADAPQFFYPEQLQRPPLSALV